MKLEAKLNDLVVIEAELQGDLTWADCKQTHSTPTEWCGG